MNILWSDPAAQDLENIEIYIFQDNPRAAIDTVLKILDRVESLLDNPAMGRAGRVFGTKELVLANLPYIVIYRVRNSTIDILRVLHSAQMWPK